MRIVCQKCAATYVIDDKLIKAKGVRAQCPRCRNTQLVKPSQESAPEGAAPPVPELPPAAAPGVAAPAPAPPAAPPIAAPPGVAAPLASAAPPRGPAPAPAPAAFAAEAADPLAEFLGGASAPAAPPPPAPPAAPPPASLAAQAAVTQPGFARPAPSYELGGPPTSVQSAYSLATTPQSPSSLFDLTAPPLGTDPAQPAMPPPGKAGRPPVEDSPEPVVVNAAELESFPADTDPGRSQVTVTKIVAPPTDRSAPEARCNLCGKPLKDEFDRVLGTCESCRAKDSQAPAARVEVLEELPPAPEAEGGVRLGRLKPAPEEGRAAKADSRTPTAPMVGMPGVTVVAGTGDSGRTGRLVAVAAAVVLLAGGGGAAWYFLRGAGGEDPGQNAPAERPLPPPVQAAVERWQRRFPNLQGEAAPLLNEGLRLLGQERHEAYVKAVGTLQKALVLNPRSNAAMAGYVQALALAHGSRLEEPTFKEALELVEASKPRKEIHAGLLLAHANLLLTRPLSAEQAEQVRQLAEQAEASGSPPEKAEAHLVLGRLYLGSSRELASEHLEKALALEPKLARAYHYRALERESAGDYAGALDSLRKRLEVDESNPDSLKALARLLAEVGEVPQARKVYEERTQGKEARLEFQLPLAALRYQVEGGKPSEALSLLRGLNKGRERYKPEEAAELLVHLATAERLGNSAQAAAKAARDALELRKDMPEAALQLFLVHLAQKDEAEAARQFESLRGRLESPALEKVLEGRLRLLEGKPEQALALLQEAGKLDSRRVDAALLAGVAAAQAGQRSEAFRLLFEATLSDPLRVAPREPVLSRFYLRPGETLQGVEGVIAKLAESKADVTALLYEGVLSYHQGDLAGAEKLLRKVNEEDLNNASSLAYRALVALQRRDMSQARSLSERAVAADRRKALHWLVRGLVLAEEAKQADQAQKALREALTLAPGMLSAEVKLAELEARAKNVESARSRLLKVLVRDPSYSPAKRALYQLEK